MEGSIVKVIDATFRSLPTKSSKQTTECSPYGHADEAPHHTRDPADEESRWSAARRIVHRVISKEKG